jgi:hypothetical protein
MSKHQIKKTIVQSSLWSNFEIATRSRPVGYGQPLQRAVMALELMNGVRIECNVCEGTGEVCIGHTSGGYWSPPEPVEDECPICEGWGHYNKREIHEEWDGPPCAEAAIEMLADSYTEREYEND